MEKSFHGKKAAVIGGTGGIGREISLRLVEEGASVCSVGRHSLPGTESMILDLDTPENRIAVLDKIRQSDILCVARGAFLQKALHETTAAEWESIVSSNLTFPGMLVSAVLPHMRQAGWGRIFLFGGTRTDSVRGFRTNAAYAAAKTGVSSLVKSVALSYAAEGITCNAVCPGFVDTEYLDAGAKARLSAKNPDGKLISSRDIAELALFLMKNNVYNGTIVPADKGWAPALI